MPFTRVAVLLCSLAALAAAQEAIAQCDPTWDPAIGTPGVPFDYTYVQPIIPWTDPAGPAIYAGGSFDHIGGKSILVVARYDTAANTWSKMGTGINIGNTNGFATSLALFNPGGGDRLVLGGFFISAGGQPDTQSLAMWNGAAWSSLGGGLLHDAKHADAVWSMLATGALGGNFLYVGGQFDTIGGQQAFGIASWDGQRWTGMSHSPMGGYSPAVFSLQVFDDGSGPALYAAGRFTSLDGVQSPFVIRWDGHSWSRPGTGLTSNDSLSDAEALAVFDDGSGPALYAGGWTFQVPGGPQCSIAKWDGAKWTAVGGDLGGRTTALAVFDDGSGPALFCGGTAQPGIKYFAKLVNGQWQTYRGGITDPPNGPPWPSIFGLSPVGDSLYIGGEFPEVDGVDAGSITRLVACHQECYADFNGDGALDLFDFLAFVNSFNAGEPGADCDGDQNLTLFDFLCFVNAFNAGC